MDCRTSELSHVAELIFPAPRAEADCYIICLLEFCVTYAKITTKHTLVTTKSAQRVHTTPFHQGPHGHYDGPQRAGCY